MEFFRRANVVLVVLAGLFVALTRADLSGIPLPPFLESPKQITVEATGPAPWTIEGYGWRYTVESVTQTTSEWQFEKKPSLTIVAYIERSEDSFHPAMEYRISDQASGAVLDSVPFQGGGDGSPPLHQRSKLVHVVWDTSPRASRLTITLHDFYWPDGQDLVLSGVSAPAGSP
jgi:hypothetical protein